MTGLFLLAVNVGLRQASFSGYRILIVGLDCNKGMMMDFTRPLGLIQSALSFSLMILVAACAAGSGSQSIDAPRLYAGKIAVIEEHPFDVEKEIAAANILDTRDIIAFMEARGTATVGTDYDKMHSVVALLDGPFQQGDQVIFDYRQYVDGKWYDYARTFSINHDPRGGAVLIVGSYRINRDASVYLDIKVRDEVIAEHRFKVKGPRHPSDPPYAIEPGGRKLSAQEVHETISGNTFRRDEGGILTFLADGTYLYEGETRDTTGTWEIRSDGKACVSFSDGRLFCVVLYYDREGNLKYSSESATKWRIRKEA